MRLANLKTERTIVMDFNCNLKLKSAKAAKLENLTLSA